MEIKPNRLVYLGYGKYWRSDQIAGLVPIEDERGPGRRTLVYVGSLSEPIIASRSEESIRLEMTGGSDAEFRSAELRSAAAELAEELVELKPVLRRMLLSEAGMDVDRWQQRLRELAASSVEPDESDQEDLFDLQS